MVYMGSKRKYLKDIIPIIQEYIDKNNIENFVDCFCGGASVSEAIRCKNKIANDLSYSLIELHRWAQFTPQEIPEHCDRADWDTAYAEWKKYKMMIDKNPTMSIAEIEKELAIPLKKIGAIEWYASFSNGGFPRGYAKPSHNRDYYNEAYRNHQRQAADEEYKKIQFIAGNYQNIIDKLDMSANPSNTLFYCDSPYKGTKPYAINPKFNYEEYYNWLREMGRQVPIFISEQSMPEDFELIWEKDVIRTTNKTNDFKATEKLYFIHP